MTDRLDAIRQHVTDGTVLVHLSTPSDMAYLLARLDAVERVVAAVSHLHQVTQVSAFDSQAMYEAVADVTQAKVAYDAAVAGRET